jgi:hypothetical protein
MKVFQVSGSCPKYVLTVLKVRYVGWMSILRLRFAVELLWGEYHQ